MSGSKGCPRFYDAIRRYGPDAFHLEFLSHGRSEGAAFLDEMLAIYLKEPRYNLTIGGEGTSGHKGLIGVPRSQVTRDRIARAKRGVSLSSAHMAAILAGNATPEAKANRSRAKKGIRMSDESIRKMAATKRNSHPSSAALAAAAAAFREGMSARAVADEFGVQYGSLNKRLRADGWVCTQRVPKVIWVRP